MKLTGTEKQVRFAEEIRRDLGPLILARIVNLTDQRAASAARLATRTRNRALSEQIADLDDEIAYLRDAIYCRDAKWWIDHRAHGLELSIRLWWRSQTARERSLCLGLAKPRGSLEAVAVAIGVLGIAGAVDQVLSYLVADVTSGDEAALAVLLDIAESRGLGR